MKEVIEDFSFYMKKLFKTMTKIRQLKLSFTIEDERLINLIEDTPEDFHPSIQEINSKYDEMKLFISNLIYEFEELNKAEEDEFNDEFNQKVIHFSGEYINFMQSKSDNQLEQFFVQTYLFRNDQFNEVLNFSSELLNIMLNKLELLKASIFMKYVQEDLLKEISSNVTHISEQIKRFTSSGDYLNNFESLGLEVFQLEIAFNFIKSFLSSRNPQPNSFFNTFMKQNGDSVLKDLRESEMELANVKKELSWIGEIVNSYEGFINAYDDLDKAEDIINSGKVSLSNFEIAQNYLFNFNAERQKGENFLKETRCIEIKFKSDLMSKMKSGNKKYMKLKEGLLSLSI
jgi:hypothetical protein